MPGYTSLSPRRYSSIAAACRSPGVPAVTGGAPCIAATIDSDRQPATTNSGGSAPHGFSSTVTSARSLPRPPPHGSTPVKPAHGCGGRPYSCSAAPRSGDVSKRGPFSTVAIASAEKNAVIASAGSPSISALYWSSLSSSMIGLMTCVRARPLT